jgi:aminoglycoside phosphotransferase (APT) family kinase protein
MFEQFIGTKPVDERHRIDVRALEKFLGFGIPAIEQFKGGQSNPTYRLTGANGKKYVLRRKPPGKLLPSAHAVDREYRVIAALHPVGFPVAKPLALCEDDSVIGTAFYVMDCVEGRVLWDQSLPGMTKRERFEIWDELNRVIALLHTLDYRQIGLEAFGKPGNYIERQVGRWSKQYQASETEPMEAMNNLIAWLPKNIPPETVTTVVHGDYRLDNVIFHPTQPKILAVLDWELSTLGHPLADLGYNCMIYHFGEGFGASDGYAGMDLEAFGIPNEKDYVAAYARRTGRQEIADWDFYVAFSLFRLAAIVQGVYKRGLDGNASSETAKSYGDRARVLAELGWSLVKGRA